MGAYTSAMCYRAGSEPPVITCEDLAAFVQRVLALDILGDGDVSLSLKFGACIDQDDRSTEEWEEVNDIVCVDAGYDWDIDEIRISSEGSLEILHNPPTSRVVPRKRRHVLDVFGPKTVEKTLEPNIYRAYLSFGSVRRDISVPLCHQLEDNYLCLSDLSFMIAPVLLSDPQQALTIHAGWMSMSISGGGYLFPWTYDEALERLRSQPDLARVQDICREFWPATKTPPSPEVVSGRQKMGGLWAEPTDAPYDWYWAINETY